MTTGNRAKKNNIGIIVIMCIVTAAVCGIGFLVEWDKTMENKESLMIVQIEEEPIVIKQEEVAEPVSAEPEDQGEEVPEIRGKYEDYLNDTERMQKENAYALETQEQDVVTVTFAGDVLLDDEYAIMASMIRRSGSDRENYIEDAIDAPLLEMMRDADLCIINNEFPYTDRGEPTPDKMFTFRADTKEAQLLHDMGVDLVSLANNHASDFGEISLRDSMDTLEKEGIPYVGAGHNLEEASRPVYFVTDKLKIAVLSATQIERMDNPATKGATENGPGVFRCRNVDHLLQQVAYAKENSDFVIVFIHWGTENAVEPDMHQLDQAPRLAEAGADLIVGHHPHVLQGIDWIDGTPVVYSIGNFLFGSKTLDSCLVRATLDAENGTLQELQFVPAIQKGSRSVFPDEMERSRIITYVQNFSPNVLIDSEGCIQPKDSVKTVK